MSHFRAKMHQIRFLACFRFSVRWSLTCYWRGTACRGPPMSLLRPFFRLSNTFDCLVFRPRNKCVLESDAKFEISGVLRDGIDG